MTSTFKPSIDFCSSTEDSKARRAVYDGREGGTLKLFTTWSTRSDMEQVKSWSPFPGVSLISDLTFFFGVQVWSFLSLPGGIFPISATAITKSLHYWLLKITGFLQIVLPFSLHFIERSRLRFKLGSRLTCCNTRMPACIREDAANEQSFLSRWEEYRRKFVLDV